MNYSDLFSIRCTYLNNASVSPLPNPTVKEMERYLRERQFFGGKREMEWFERVETTRSLAATLIGAKREEVALTKSTTHGLILISQSLPLNRGDEIILVKGEFPANIYPFLSLQEKGIKVRFIEPNEGRVDRNLVESALTERTRLLAISFVDYLTGHRRDLKEIGLLLRERGVFFSVDAIQGLGVFEINTSEMPIDFLSSGGTKWLLSPMGTGILYVREELLDLLKLPFTGWRGVINFLDFSNYDPTPRKDAKRFEMDTYNLAGIIGFGRSLKLIEEIGLKEIKKRVIALTDIIFDALNSVDRIDILTPRSRDDEKSGILTFKVKGVDPNTIREKLAEKDIIVSVRERYIRVSPHFYNTKEDVERFIEVLTHFI